MRRRHNVGGHGWGIVSGLELELAGGDVVVNPGLAIDGYGREVIVASPARVPLTGFDPPLEALEVWLLYGRGAFSPAQHGRFACGPGREGRWLEEARIRLRRVPEEGSDTGERRAPEEVPDADLDFGPQDIPPDDPEREWPIFLGTITLGGSTDTNPFDPAGRPYATLVGATVVHPSGSARLQLGADRAGDRRRFAFAVGDRRGSFRDRIVIDDARNTIIDGDVDVIPRETTDLDDGRLTIGNPAPGAPARITGLELNPPIVPPAEASPWRIYRAAGTAAGVQTDELRVEIAHPGEKGDPSAYRLAVGRLNDAGDAFDDCLSVDADCTVRVHGDLNVQGRLIPGPVHADLNDPRFGAALADGLATGAAATGSAPQVVVQWTSGASPGVEATYTATISTSGANPLSIVALLETASLGGKPQPTENLHSPELPLLVAPGAPAVVEGKFNVSVDASAGQELALMVVAVATDAAGRAWYGSGAAPNITVTSP
jgi:hypothetical protein